MLNGPAALRQDRYDALVIGGGFYGCAVALAMSEKGRRVALVEAGPNLMQRASYVNQARIHQGYHYPRSILTARRSRVNFDRFVEEFEGCVYSRFDQYYAVGRLGSKVNAEQFRLFCARVGAPLKRASKEVKALLDPNLVEDVFLVHEYAFDADKLRALMRDALERRGVEFVVDCRADRVGGKGARLAVSLAGAAEMREVEARHVFNCTYSQINRIMQASDLPLVPLKHELTEMALVEMPEPLRGAGFTLMDGPFFSVMPFPARGLHSLSHVRYTPHHYWQEGADAPWVDTQRRFGGAAPRSRQLHMVKDASRYLPALGESRYVESLWEVKTVLPQSEVDDSRPILFRSAERLPGLVSIMGGKIDNVFDIRDRLDAFLQESAA